MCSEYSKRVCTSRWIHNRDLRFTVDVFLVIWIKEVRHAVVGDLDLVVILQQDVASSQVPVDHAVLLQVVHALKHKCTLMRLSRGSLSVISSCTHFGDLDAPVEQTLGVQAGLVLSDVFQQGAMWTELRHQLQTGTWTYPQQSNNVWVVQTAHGQHMLCGEILNASFYICKQAFSLAVFKMFHVLFPTSVISVKVCRPELSWIVLMATGIFTVSPSGIQNPLNRQNCNHTNYLH